MHRQALLAAAVTTTLGCCVAEGTTVATPLGPRAVETLRVGDSVYSVDVESGLRVAVAITAIRSATRECVGIDLGTGERLVCTSDHPIFDPACGAYRPAGDWVTEPGRAVLGLTRQLEERVPVSTSAFVGLFRVFDLTVSGSHHNFVAASVVVHNKSIRQDLPEVDGTDEYSDEGSEDEDAWFDEVEASPCEDPLPEGAGCLTLRGKPFYLTGGTATVFSVSQNNVVELEFPGTTTVVLQYPQALVGENPCQADSSFTVYVDDYTLEKDSCIWTLPDEPTTPGGTASGSMNGYLEVEGEQGLWHATMTWSAVPVAP